MQELTRLAVELVKPEELSRAKNMLKSMMMMQLESRMVICEDIGRQLITYGHRQVPLAISSHNVCGQMMSPGVKIYNVAWLVDNSCFPGVKIYFC